MRFSMKPERKVLTANGDVKVLLSLVRRSTPRPNAVAEFLSVPVFNFYTRSFGIARRDRVSRGTREDPHTGTIFGRFDRISRTHACRRTRTLSLD